MGINYNPRIVTDGLVLCLDAGNPRSYPGSGTTWTDLSGRGNTGTLIDGPTYSSSDRGNIVLTAASRQYISIPNMPLYLTNVSKFTYSTFIKVTAVSSSAGMFFSFGSDLELGNDITFYYVSNNLYFQVNNGGDGFGSLPRNFGSWENITLVYDGTQTGNSNRLVAYINGLPQTLTFSTNFIVPSTTSSIPFTKCWIGGYSTAPLGSGAENTFISGNISQVSLYNRALSASEVQQNFAALRGRFGI